MRQPAPGEIVVIAEVRYGVGGMSTRHDGAKYEMYAERTRAIVRDVLGDWRSCRCPLSAAPRPRQPSRAGRPLMALDSAPSRYR